MEYLTWVFVFPQATIPLSSLTATSRLLLADEIATGKRFSLTKTSTVGVETLASSDTALSTASPRATSADDEACRCEARGSDMDAGPTGNQKRGRCYCFLRCVSSTAAPSFRAATMLGVIFEGCV